MNSNNIYYIWLSIAINGSYDVYKELIDTFGSVYEIYSAEGSTYERLSRRVSRRTAALSDKSLERAVKISDYCNSRGITIITYENDAYPSLLKDIDRPPIILYVRGKMPRFEHDLHVAVVGTRKMTDYGKCMAYNIGYSLARNGAVVVSGMALGNDSVAMCASLDAGNRCVGVLGCGVDIAYPPEHAGFLENIVTQGGAVISEYPPGTVPKPEFFIERNRIISGLCRATLMIEGDIKSGAMYTARFASKYGRKLFAVPGKIGEKASSGSLSLISDGANVVLEANDVLKEFVFLYRGSVDLKTYPDLDSETIDGRLYERGVRTAKSQRKLVAGSYSFKDPEPEVHRKKPDPVKVFSDSMKKRKEDPPQLSQDHRQKIDALPANLRKIYDQIPKNVILVADEAVAYGVPVSDFMYAVTMLELQGLVVVFPGSRYCFK
jgi:DNA processing protein